MPASTRREASLLSGGQLLLLLLCSGLPGLALVQASGEFKLPYLAALPVGASVLSYVLCYVDKQRAKAGEWRTPEATLHLFELAGGWPGSFVAQRQFRHKTSKSSYQSAFWFIVLLHQVVAVDFLRGWPWVGALVQQASRVVE